MAKHIYDLKPLKQGTAPLFHVVTDGIVVSTHKTEAAARKKVGAKPFHRILRQDHAAGFDTQAAGAGRVERYGNTILTTLSDAFTPGFRPVCHNALPLKRTYTIWGYMWKSSLDKALKAAYRAGGDIKVSRSHYEVDRKRGGRVDVRITGFPSAAGAHKVLRGTDEITPNTPGCNLFISQE